jgi:hypothetical protein
MILYKGKVEQPEMADGVDRCGQPRGRWLWGFFSLHHDPAPRRPLKDKTRSRWAGQFQTMYYISK